MDNLNEEFEEAKFKIQVRNYQEIIKKLITFFIDLEASKTGLEISDTDVFYLAHERFCELKKSGKIDELNCLH